jgi:hypothetical protein
MQRDMDLIRQILLELEAHQDPRGTVVIRAEGYSPEQVAYHVKLMAECGLVDAVNFSTMGRMDWRPRSLTWAGHEFLDATRNDGVWHRLKAEVKDRGLSLPFELVKELAIKIAAQAAGLSS